MNLLLDFVLFNGIDEMLLTEANILNIKDLHGQVVSIHSYLKTFTDELPDEMKNSFVKKIATLLINDERFHQAARELPDGAPEWAVKAQQARDLYVFVPTPSLNDILTHAVHYLSAANHDSKQQANRDQQVFAQRELQGWPKLGSLDLVEKKSQEYFKRGTRKQTRDISGMEQVLDAGRGFTWWKLIEPAAFQREGKLLQNCIGTFYTAEKLKKAKQVILVMRDHSDNSVVATRLQDQGENKWEMQEVKGKQNRPPVGKYMPPVVNLINKMDIKMSNGAKYDMRNAGYYIHTDDTIYTKADAIKKFVNFDPITKIGYGLTLGKVNSEIGDLLVELYKDMTGGYAWRFTGKEIYESRNATGNPVVSVMVANKVIENVKVYDAAATTEVTENVVNQLTGDSDQALQARETISQLFKRGIAERLEDAAAQQLFWSRKQLFDPDKKDFTTAEHDQEHDFGEGFATWKEYTSKNVITTVLSGLEQTHRYRQETYPLPEVQEVKSVFMTIDSIERDGGQENIDIHRILVRDKKDMLYPAAWTGEGSNSPKSSYAVAEWAARRGRATIAKEDPRIVNTLIKLANDHRLDLWKQLQMDIGAFKRRDGKYEKITFEPTPVSGDTGAVKYDLTRYDADIRSMAIFYVLTHAELSADQSRHPFDLKFTDIEKNQPTAVIKVPVRYGGSEQGESHPVFMLLKGATVTALDLLTKQHAWRRWDDFQKVVDQVNKVVDQNNLSVDTKAARGSKQITITRGKFDLKSSVEERRILRKRERGQYGMEGTDELPFANGWKLMRVTPEEQAQYMRTVTGASKRGEMWKLSDHNEKAVAVVFVQNNKVVAGYYAAYNQPEGTEAHSILPPVRINVPGISPYTKYFKTAGSTFNWTFANTNKNSIKLGSKLFDTLRYVVDSGGLRRQHPSDDMTILKLHGLVSITNRTLHTKHIGVTPEGLRVYDRVRRGETVNLVSLLPGEPLDPEFTTPERAEPPARPATGAATPTGAPREGTKAQMAVDRFREILAANNNVPPSRQEFMRILQQAPFNMSAAAAQTYYYNTKKRVAQMVGESTELGKLLLADIPNDGPFKLFNDFLSETKS